MTSRKILVKGNPIQKEAQAGGAITPGHLLQWSGANLVVHATADGAAQVMIALEDFYTDTNNSATSAIDTAYASGQTLPYVVPHRGCEVYMVLASGENVAKGAALVSNGNGQLKEEGTLDATVIETAVIGYAAEAVDASGGASRITVEIA